jgi:predicted RNA methylase
VPVTRPTLAAASWLRRHGDRARTATVPHRPRAELLSSPDVGPAGLAPRRGASMTQDASVLAVGEALRRGAPVADAELDQVFPDELRDRSHLHWTPVAIAMRAAELLAPTPDTRVLDVGAGVGKLCLVGALATGAMWWGIEQDPLQVEAARHAAWALDATRCTRFVCGDGSRLAWDEFDALYFYNPFSTVMLAPHASPFVRYATIQATLRRIEQRLAATRPGTRVVTFHGFGGQLPPVFRLAAREPAGGGALELWICEPPPSA